MCISHLTNCSSPVDIPPGWAPKGFPSAETMFILLLLKEGLSSQDCDLEDMTCGLGFPDSQLHPERHYVPALHPFLAEMLLWKSKWLNMCEVSFDLKIS